MFRIFSPNEDSRDTENPYDSSQHSVDVLPSADEEDFFVPKWNVSYSTIERYRKALRKNIEDDTESHLPFYLPFHRYYAVEELLQRTREYAFEDTDVCLFTGMNSDLLSTFSEHAPLLCENAYRTRVRVILTANAVSPSLRSDVRHIQKVVNADVVTVLIGSHFDGSGEHCLLAGKHGWLRTQELPFSNKHPHAPDPSGEISGRVCFGDLEEIEGSRQRFEQWWKHFSNAPRNTIAI